RLYQLAEELVAQELPPVALVVVGIRLNGARDWLKRFDVGNLAESVAELKRWILTTTKGNRGLALGASRVVLQMLQLISEEENWKTATNFHNTVKPTHLMSWLVRLVSKEGDTVLDPFLGSGTTGVACLNLKRNFIGFELDKDYFEIAKARIEKAKNNTESKLF
ncbi:MAG: DNA-methyltransferase, partial [Flammeovirgaceae bacterium]